MGFLDRLFGKKRSVAQPEAAAALYRAPGMETLQTDEEQASTRRAMEAEMASQRERRGQANPPKE